MQYFIYLKIDEVLPINEGSVRASKVNIEGLSTFNFDLHHIQPLCYQHH